MGPELTRFRLDEKIELADEADYCCHCGNCEMVCPSGVKVSLLNAHYKSQWKKSKDKLNLRDNMLGRPGVLAQLGSFHVGLTNFMMGQDVIKFSMDKFLGISKEHSLPAYQKQSFTNWFKKREVKQAEKQVVYFAGCFTNYNAPEVGKAVVRILEHNGYQVIVPDQGCCGLPLMANGYMDAAKKQGAKNLRSFMPYVEQGCTVIINCTSCSLTWKSEYHELFGIEGAEKAGSQVYEFGQFLQELHARGELDTDFKSVPVKLAYHNPCHLKKQGIGKPFVDLLKLIPDLEIEDINQGCCGLSGSYGFKKEKYQIAMDIGSDIFAKVDEMNPDAITTECGGCGMQIGHGTGREVKSPVLFLERAYGIEE